MRKLSCLLLLLAISFPVWADAPFTPAEQQYLTILETLAADQGSLTPAVISGSQDRSLVKFGRFICQAQAQQVPEDHLLAFIQKGVSNCTPKDLLLGAVVTARTYLCNTP
jgi:hypothetical protein